MVSSANAVTTATAKASIARATASASRPQKPMRSYRLGCCRAQVFGTSLRFGRATAHGKSPAAARALRRVPDSSRQRVQSGTGRRAAVEFRIGTGTRVESGSGRPRPPALAGFVSPGESNPEPVVARLSSSGLVPPGGSNPGRAPSGDASRHGRGVPLPCAGCSGKFRSLSSLPAKGVSHARCCPISARPERARALRALWAGCGLTRARPPTAAWARPRPSWLRPRSWLQPRWPWPRHPWPARLSPVSARQPHRPSAGP